MKKDDVVTELTFTQTHKVTVDRVQCLLVSALEGGSNYWYCKASINRGSLTTEDFLAAVLAFNEGNDFPLGRYFVAPFIPGCGVKLWTSDDDGKPEKEYEINLDSIKRGLEQMATNKARRQEWLDFVEENDDAGTADVFLQLALFGEVVYG